VGLEIHYIHNAASKEDLQDTAI